METDIRRMRGDRSHVFVQLKRCEELETIIRFPEWEGVVPKQAPEERCLASKTTVRWRKAAGASEIK